MGIYVTDKFVGKPALHPIAYHSANQSGFQNIKKTISTLFEAVKRKYAQYRTHRVNRAAFQHLVTLDDGILDDIGVTRSDVKWASQLPLSQNAALELEIIARSNKQTRR